MSELAVQERAGGVRFTVRVQPRASRNEVGGLHGDALKVRLTAAPVGGAANDALVALLAERLGVPRRAVRIVAGGSSRVKVIEVAAIARAAVDALAHGVGPC